VVQNPRGGGYIKSRQRPPPDSFENATEFHTMRGLRCEAASGFLSEKEDNRRLDAAAKRWQSNMLTPGP
jgi:hypothetical protein